MYHIVFKGLVQGVGFRPLVKKTADNFDIKGIVFNSSEGVEIYADGNKSVVGSFVSFLLKNLPQSSYVESYRIDKFESNQLYKSFEIVQSKKNRGITLIPTDLAVCPQCLSEMENPDDRRYMYPFINCVNCGPRYSIIRALPYDRKSTSMDSFTMCPNCAKEYKDNTDRRFHAQPIACPVCGPKIYLEVNGEILNSGDNAVEEAALFIDSGAIIAVLGIGGYHLVCDACNQTAVEHLIELKGRGDKPLAIMCEDTSSITTHITPLSYEALTSHKSPIVVMPWCNPPFSQKVSGGLKTVGVLLAYTPLHKILFKKIKTKYLVATSANCKGEPIEYSPKSAVTRLKNITRIFLHHDRGILNPIDDSVVKQTAFGLSVIRRARGYAPFSVNFGLIEKELPGILAVGGNLKNTLTVTNGSQAFVSPFIGDLEDLLTAQRFIDSSAFMLNSFEVKPLIIVSDKHPDLFTTRFAEKYSIEMQVEHIRIQHHIAHAYATMAEHKLKKNVIAVVMDGNGLGDDGAIWGGEFFAIGKDITRVAHLKYQGQIAGDVSARYPSIMAYSYLMASLSDYKGYLQLLGLDLEKAALYESLFQKNLNIFPTSSAGRLFEAAGALVLGISENTYEGHCAVMFENLAAGFTGFCDGYDFELTDGKVDVATAFAQFAKDVKNGECKQRAAYRFHLGFACMIDNVCRTISLQSGYNDIVLSGGVFQNTLLLELTVDKLKSSKFNIYTAVEVPCNDSGLSLGQAYKICLDYSN